MNGSVGVTFQVRTALSIFSLRGAPRDPGGADAFPLPTAPNTAISVPCGDVLWLGRDEWLLCVEKPIPELLARWHGDVTDVSHGRCILRIGGDSAREILSTGVSIDLHPRAFRPGACVQTRFGRVDVVVHRLGEGGGFDFHVSRSYALHCWETLLYAARGFGYETR